MMTLFFPLVGCQTGTPGSINLHSSLNTADSMIQRLLRPAAMSSKSITDLRDRVKEGRGGGISSMSIYMYSYVYTMYMCVCVSV